MTPVQQMIEAAEAVVRRWESPDWKDQRSTADYIAALRTAVQALREAAAPTGGRWYSLSKLGQATLCLDEADAIATSAESDALYPAHGPHRAVQLVPAVLREVPAESAGWKLVPVEPTEKMVSAMPFPSSVTPRIGIECYRAMLAAAPQPPAREAPQEAVAEVRADSAHSYSIYFLPAGRNLEPGAKLYAAPPAPAQAVAQWRETGEEDPSDGQRVLAAIRPYSNPDNAWLIVDAVYRDGEWFCPAEQTRLHPAGYWMPAPPLPGATPASAAGDGD